MYLTSTIGTLLVYIRVKMYVVNS